MPIVASKRHAPHRHAISISDMPLSRSESITESQNVAAWTGQIRCRTHMIRRGPSIKVSRILPFRRSRTVTSATGIRTRISGYSCSSLVALVSCCRMLRLTRSSESWIASRRRSTARVQ
jgi:hypothetical protein